MLCNWLVRYFPCIRELGFVGSLRRVELSPPLGLLFCALLAPDLRPPPPLPPGLPTSRPPDRERFLLVRARNLLLPGGQGRLSFIGHSAGAVIIRAALTSRSLKPALGRLHLFVSLGSPHLGTVYGSSGIVRTGMWAMKRWVCRSVGRYREQSEARRGGVSCHAWP